MDDEDNPVPSADFTTAPESECKLALRFLMDGSSSVKDGNWRRQLDTTADALDSPMIRGIIRSNGHVVLGADGFDHGFHPLIPWTHIVNGNGLDGFIADLRAYHPQPNGATSISTALHHALDTFPEADCPEGEHKIDISTDAQDSNINVLQIARERAEKEGVQINGISIGPAAQAILKEFAVTEGGKAFPAEYWEYYGDTFLEKLTYEIALNDAPQEPKPQDDLPKKEASLPRAENKYR